MAPTVNTFHSSILQEAGAKADSPGNHFSPQLAGLLPVSDDEGIPGEGCGGFQFRIWRPSRLARRLYMATDAQRCCLESSSTGTAGGVLGASMFSFSTCAGSAPCCRLSTGNGVVRGPRLQGFFQPHAMQLTELSCVESPLQGILAVLALTATPLNTF